MRKSLLTLTLTIAAASPLWAQVPTAPTSTPLEKTLHPLFPKTAGPCEVESKEAYSNFRILLRYDAGEGSQPKVTVHGDHEVVLPAGDSRTVEIAYEHAQANPARVRIWHDGKLVDPGHDIANSAPTGTGRQVASVAESGKKFRFDRDFTAMVVFSTRKGGPLVAKAAAVGKWSENGKMLFIRDGRLVYDIGWFGELVGKSRVNDGKRHVAVLQLDGKTARLYLDGKLEAEKKGFTKPDMGDHVFKVGAGTDDFGGKYEGKIANVRWWKRALNVNEVKQLSTGKEDAVNTPDFNWKPGGAKPGKPEARELVETTFGRFPGYATRIRLSAGAGFTLKSAVVQPLEVSDHAELIRNWDVKSLARGKEVYGQLCVVCHGTVEKEGSLPTALRFHEGQFKNGNDPYRMFQTLEKGYGMMVAQPQYNLAQKYDVIHYVRETFLKGKNKTQLAVVDEDYLDKLPRGMSTVKEVQAPRKAKQYIMQDYGNALFWTMQVEPGNIAQKGIAVRVDLGPGGVVNGKAWMLYDHDTMRLAACWTGDKFVDWRGIAFDGSHGSHTSIVGEKQFVFPNEPAWANPRTNGFEDVRIRGRDNKPYGPLPRDWVHFKGLEMHGGLPVLRYTVGECVIRESPGYRADGTFVRHLSYGPSRTPLTLRLDAEKNHTIAASAKGGTLVIEYSAGGVRVAPNAKVAALPKPVSGRFLGTLTTRIVPGNEDGPFAVDVLTPPKPAENPWHSWMRTSGFDFFEGGKSAAVCTWNGDVWIVDGLDQSEGEMKWQRICAGLFQPLGVRIVDGEIYIGCRDMIAKLVDHNGDRETDYIESFNNDHQVTEHFHEFAMGLQTDEEGNFYYAKSARHALKAVVPHHGTLLRVSKDGKKTTILATGFRAANGVCLNPDGTFIVTDQEGHWNPKNRINWVKGTGKDDFYGNMYGYHSVTDESDAAMTPPLCWITNRFDRSPAELLWVPVNSAWKSLRGSLLNLSYGYGKVYVVPHEKVNGQVQGGMCQLPFKQFPTGVMRGRFHPGDGQLYACGMFAWAGSQNQPGGFYRIRYTGKPAHAPVGLTTAKQTVVVTFTDALEKESSEKPEAWTIEAWGLKRTKSYGSKHYNQRQWKVEKAALSADGKTVTLTIPELAPTWGMSIRCKIRGATGEEVQREIHNSIHALGK